MKSIFISILILTIGYSELSAQEFEKKHDTSGVVFSGLWKPVQASDPASPLQLCVLVENTNDYIVETTFTVVFFDTGIELETSQPIELCIKPGKKIKGRKYGLCLISEEISNEKITSDSFAWAVDDVEVKKTAACK